MLYFVKAQWLPSKVGSMPVIYQWLMTAAFISLCFIMTVLPRSVLGLVMCRIAGRERNCKAALEPRGIKLRLIIYPHTTGASGTHFMLFHAASPQSNVTLRQGRSPRSNLRLSGLIKAGLAEELAFADFLAKIFNYTSLMKGIWSCFNGYNDMHAYINRKLLWTVSQAVKVQNH